MNVSPLYHRWLYWLSPYSTDEQRAEAQRRFEAGQEPPEGAWYTSWPTPLPPHTYPCDDRAIGYTQGVRAATIGMLQHLLGEIRLHRDDGHIAAPGVLDTSEVYQRGRWEYERAMAVQALREICEEHGDNDWSDDLNLSDVLQKHLAPYLQED